MLFGHDVTAGAIAYEIDGAAEVKIFFRDSDALRAETANLRPFMLLQSDEPLSGWKGEAQIEYSPALAPSTV